MGADGSFSPVAAGEKGGGAGPSSNTGQKGGALIDYFTATFPRQVVEEHRLTNLQHLLDTLFGTAGKLRAMSLRNKSWQFYQQSSVILDREGEMCGRIGINGNGDTVCVSISGAGCRWVDHWERVGIAAQLLQGKLSRVDCAFDDLDGECLDVHALRARANNGDFAMGGRPPNHRFLSDEGHGSGSTLYVGAKGHKELCIYEKGKMLGLPESKWVRAEVRMYGKHTALPWDVLTRPLDYLRGSYSVLQEVITGFATRIKTLKRSVSIAGEAMVRYLHRQIGPSLNLLREVFGSEWAAFAEQRIVREGHPGRFRGVAKGDHLVSIMREQLCPTSR